MANVFQLKKDICEIGQRIYNKGFAAANDGNITVKISDNEFLCTPTMHSKGFLKPDDICTIDGQGNQTAGRVGAVTHGIHFQDSSTINHNIPDNC